MATSDFLSPKQLKTVARFNIEAITLLSIAILTTGLRTYSRVRMVGFKHFQADDCLVLVGATFDIIETVLAYCVGEVGRALANNSMTDEARAALAPDSREYRLRILGSKFQVYGWLCYSILLWSLKGAVCTFYLRVMSGLYEYRRRIYTGFALLGATWLGVTLNLFLSCRPFHHMWQINPNPGITCQPAISPALVWGYWSANVATDLYLVSIPLPMLFRSSMPVWRKIALCCLFGCGSFIVIAATVRVALLVSNPTHGPLLGASWAVRETFLAVITTNVPVIFPLLKLWLGPIIGSLGYNPSGSKKSSSDPIRLPAVGTVGGRGAERRGPQSPNPIPNITLNESEERIIGGMGLGPGIGPGMHGLSRAGDSVSRSFIVSRSEVSPEGPGVESQIGRSRESSEMGTETLSDSSWGVGEVDSPVSLHGHGVIFKRVDIDVVMEEDAPSALGQTHFATAWAPKSKEEEPSDSRFSSYPACSLHYDDGGIFDGSYRRLLK